jgi:hypothetical protein
VRDTPPLSDSTLDEAVARYRAEGWALLAGFVPPDTLAALRARAGDLLSGARPDPGLFWQAEGTTGRYDDVPKLPAPAGAGPYRKVEKLERDDVCRAWIGHSLCGRIVTRVHPTGATLYRAVLWAKPARVGSDTPWHQDAGRLWGLDRDPELQLWTALDDAPPEAGCLEVVPGSHRWGLATPLGGVVPADQVGRAEGVAVSVPARAGDVVLLHNLVWHRSGPNVTGAPRRALTVSWLAPETRCARKRREKRGFEGWFGG